MNADGSNVEQLTDNEAYDGTPDGKPIAFASNRAITEFEAFDIFVAAPDGSNATRATFGDGVQGPGSWTKPRFAADGKRLVCTRTVGASVDIFIITLR